MPHFSHKITAWLITLLFCLSQTLLASGVPIEFNPDYPSTIEVSQSNADFDSEQTPNAGPTVDNPLSVASEDSQGGSGSVILDPNVTFNGDAHPDATESKFGGASVRLDGAGDYLSALDSDDWDFGTGDFTIDFWVRFNAISGTVENTIYSHGISSIDDGTMNIYYFGDRLGFRVFNQARWIWTPSINTWYHVAITKASGTVRAFVDGSALSLADDDGVGAKSISNTSDVQIGQRVGGPGKFNGWIDEFRISKGSGRWTSNFTPLTQEYNADEYTVMLLHFNPSGPDTEAPIGSVAINNEDAVTNDPNVTLTLSAQDNRSQPSAIEMAFSQDGINFTDFEPFSATKTLMLEGSDGPKTITVRFQDEAGNFQDFFDTIILDANVIPPVPIVGAVDINGGDSETNNAEVNLALQVSGGVMQADGNQDRSIDAADYVLWRKHLGWQSAGSWDTNTADFNADGMVDQNDYNFWRGNFGNTNSRIQMAFSQDGTNFTAFEPFSPTKTLTLEGPDGLKTITVRFRDEAGNIQDFSDSIVLDITTQPEGNVLINGGAIATFSNQITLTLSTPDSGGLEMAFSQDGGQSFTVFEPFNVSKQLTLTGADSFKEIVVRYRNTAGETDIRDTIYFEYVPAPGFYLSSRNYPLALNNSWSYSGGDFQTNNVVGTFVSGGVAGFIQEYDYDGSQDYFTSDGDGFSLHQSRSGPAEGYQVISFNDPLRFVPNLIQEGVFYSDSATTTSFGFPIIFSVQTNVLPSENFIAANGASFKNVLHIQINLTDDFFGETDIVDYRFVRNLGPVQDVQSGIGVNSITRGISHYASGRKHAELFATEQAMNDPVPASFIYVEYFDENFNGTGLGRVFKRQKIDASYELLEYYDETNQIKRLERYDPNGNLTEVLEFPPGGNGSGQGSLSLAEAQSLVTSQSVPLTQTGPSSKDVPVRAPFFWQATTLSNIIGQKKMETDSSPEPKPRKSHRFNQRSGSHLGRK